MKIRSQFRCDDAERDEIWMKGAPDKMISLDMNCGEKTKVICEIYSDGTSRTYTTALIHDQWIITAINDPSVMNRVDMILRY